MSEHKALEKVFAAEIEGRLFQSKAAIYTQLEAKGLVERITRSFGKDRFGTITAEGWSLTHKGRYQYCSKC